MACPLMHSLPDLWRWMNRRRPVAFAVLYVLLGIGCGRGRSGASALFPAPQAPTWRFIDNRGKTVIAPRFEAALPYSEGLAAVKREGRWGYIDRNGSEVIPIRYRAVQSFRNGVAIVDTGLPDHPVGVIDTSGSWVTPPLFRSLSAADGPDGLLLGQKEPAEGSPSGPSAAESERNRWTALGTEGTRRGLRLLRPFREACVGPLLSGLSFRPGPRARQDRRGGKFR